MRRHQVVLLVLAFLCGSGGGLLAQDARVEARLGPETAAAVAAIVDSARAEGLPGEPLIQRALEGSAKGADGERILEAVRALVMRLRAARTALGSGSSHAELLAGAAALYVGATPTTLAGLRSTRGDAPVTIPLVVLADLAKRGVSSDAISEIVLELTEAGVTDASLEELRRLVEQDIRAGATPGVAAATRAEGILSARPPRSRRR